MTPITTPDDGVSRTDTNSIFTWLITQEDLTEFKDFIFVVWEEILKSPGIMRLGARF
jgi:hypothetical protein